MTVRAVPITSPKQWHALRATHVGASEVGAVFDVHPHLTRFELWHMKKGDLIEPDAREDERMFWGLQLEDAIARGVGERTGWTMRKARRYLSLDRLGATLDYEAHRKPDGWGVVQIKNIDWAEFSRWDDGEPPLHYELQVQQELHLTRHAWGSLGVLVGGNSLKLYERRPHGDAWNRLRDGVRSFWTSVASGEEPKPDWKRDAEAVSRVRAWAKKGKVAWALGDSDLDRQLWHYFTAKAEERDARERARILKAKILHRMGEAETIVGDTWRAHAPTRPPVKIAYERRAFRDFDVTKRERKP